MYQVGIDIGSSAAKAVVMNEGEVVRTLLLNTGFNSRKRQKKFTKHLKMRGLPRKMPDMWQPDMEEFRFLMQTM